MNVSERKNETETEIVTVSAVPFVFNCSRNELLWQRAEAQQTDDIIFQCAASCFCCDKENPITLNTRTNAHTRCIKCKRMIHKAYTVYIIEGKYHLCSKCDAPDISLDNRKYWKWCYYWKGLRLPFRDKDEEISSNSLEEESGLRNK